MNPIPPQLPAALIGIYPGVRVIVSEKLWWAMQTVSWHAYPYDVPGELPYVVRCGDFKLFGSLNLDDMSIPLDSPVAMCHAARWLAERMGMNPGVTAPMWWRYKHTWRLATYDGVILRAVSFHDGGTVTADAPDLRWIRAHGVDVEDPAAALACACMAVGGAS